MTEITTVEELDALPDGTRVRDRDGDVWEHWGGEWHTRETRPFDSAWLFRKWAPLAVLPDAPAPSAEDREALRDDIQEAIESAIPDDLPGYRQRYTDKAVDRVLAVFAAHHPTPTFTPAQRHAAEQDEALFRVATRAQFGTGEVIDMVLRALGADPVECEPTVDPAAVERATLGGYIDLTEAELVDLYWSTTGDDWAIPAEVMVRYGRAVLTAARAGGTS